MVKDLTLKYCINGLMQFNYLLHGKSFAPYSPIYEAAVLLTFDGFLSAQFTNDTIKHLLCNGAMRFCFLSKML